MKIKYHGPSDQVMFMDGKIYEVLGIEEKWYRIIDETGDDYLYPPSTAFEIIEE